MESPLVILAALLVLVVALKIFNDSTQSESSKVVVIKPGHHVRPPAPHPTPPPPPMPRHLY